MAAGGDSTIVQNGYCISDFILRFNNKTKSLRGEEAFFMKNTLANAQGKRARALGFVHHLLLDRGTCRARLYQQGGCSKTKCSVQQICRKNPRCRQFGAKKIEQRRVDGCGMFCDTCLTRHMTYGKKIADAAVGKWLRGKQEEGRGRLTKVCQKNGL